MKTFQEYTGRSRNKVDEDQDLCYREGKLFGLIQNHSTLNEAVNHFVNGEDQYESKLEEIRSRDNPEFKDHSSHHSHLANSHPEIPPSHVKYIRKYTDNSYTMNKGLYIHATTGKNKLENKPFLRQTVNGLDSIHAPISGNHVLYSGVRWNPSDASEMTYHFSDDHLAMHLPAFTSTTTSIKKASSFAQASDRSGGKKHIIRFNLKHGDIALPVHASYAAATEENEVILPRNTIIKISRTPSEIIKPSTGSKIPSSETHIWDAHILHQPRENDPI